jgi:SPP1 family predicted phage head-tail adaptor
MPTVELAAGTLDKRVTLQMPVLNEEQDEIVSWQDIATVWAGIAPASGLEEDAAARVVAITDVVVTLRFRGDLDQRWRIKETHTGVTYEIRGIVNALRRGAGLELQCREVK